MMIVLIITPSWKILGGVANHYKGMAPYWKENIRYLFQGKRMNIPAIFTILPDYLKFVATLLYERPNVVIVNTTESFKELKKKHLFLKLSICGAGTVWESAKKYVQDNALKDVEFWGNVSGKDLVMRFEQAVIYVLPTHGEGMATSVLEAMAFRLPILTCSVGVIYDFFEESKMGFFIGSNSVDDIVQKTEWLMSHPNNFKEIVDNNFLFAKKHFLASSVEKRFETDLNKYV
ncbi:glycosyltransferase family 4 protein [Segatella copri]|uniref:Glycosyltransferase family 4 protein n=1 Tax=Segatella copri TaxID=165179 RepID=A0A6G1VP03_9BACT|nr:glycosyltransferase family 4 protein [Segatella copri]MQN60496.1 glycosyltransferase family 4 protein [Segatella copri]MQP15296.1 glycosyltransferase family 4 protein [Segatella copri]